MAVSEAERVRLVYSERTGGRELYDPLRADVVAMAAERHRAWGAALLAGGVRLGRVVEVGAGSGQNLRWALDVGAESVSGVDLIPNRISDARTKNPRVVGVVGDGQRLPFPDCAFDTAICSTLFSSVLDPETRASIADEIARVLDGTGRILWFDFMRRNPSNPNVTPVNVAAVAGLFPHFDVRLERVVLAPPIARRLVTHPRLAATLTAARPLRTHLAGMLTRRPPLG